GFRLRGALRALELRFNLLRHLRELLQDLDRLVGVLRLVEPRPRRFEPCEQVLCVVQGLFSAHAASRWIRPRMPFTSLAASSDASRLANATASLIATSGGTSPVSSSCTATRRALRSTVPRRSAVQPSEAAVIRASRSPARPATASATPRAHGSISPAYCEPIAWPERSH